MSVDIQQEAIIIKGSARLTGTLAVHGRKYFQLAVPRRIYDSL